MKTPVEIIADWIEKNIETIYYLNNKGKMVFNREFVLSHLGGVIPDVKKGLNTVSGSLPPDDMILDIMQFVRNSSAGAGIVELKKQWLEKWGGRQ